MKLNSQADSNVLLSSVPYNSSVNIITPIKKICTLVVKGFKDCLSDYFHGWFCNYYL